MSDDQLVGRQTVVVTGASSGVGRAIARAFGQQAARVGLIARNAGALEHAAQEIRSAGGEAIVLPLDVADAQAVEDAATQVEERFGPIEVWVNDAMVTVMSPINEMKPEEYKRVTDVTYLGTVYGTLAALRRMLPRNRGTIIQIGSALAYRSIPLQSAYCAAKAAIRGFTDSLRTELLHDNSGVRVSMLQLPAVNTPQFDVSRTRMPKRPQPVPPIYQPELIAAAVLYAAEHAPRELWIGSGAIRAIIGQRLFPGLLDRYLAKTAYASQQTDQPVSPNRKDNLFEPVPGDRGAHGGFDERARAHSIELWARRHLKLVAAAALFACLGAAAGLGRSK